MEKKILFSLFLAVALLVVSAGCVQQVQEQQGQGEETVTVNFKYLDSEGKKILDKDVVVEKGSNAFEVLKQTVEVDVEMYDFGPFVKGVGGVETPAGYYLALYVNGSYAERGISDYVIEDGMTIEWKQEALESFGA